VSDTVRVPDGDEIVAFIAGLPSGAFVTASGWVEGVELSVARPSGDDVRAVPGRLALLSLSGPVEGPLMAVLSEPGGEGLVGGRLVKARAAGVSIGVAGAAHDAGSPRDSGRGQAPGPEVRPPADRAGEASPARSAPSTTASAWAKVAAISQDDDDETDEAPKYGDRVHHFVFGLCDVMVVRGERMKIRDVHGPGRLREIHLNAIKVLPPTVEDGKRVFKLTRRT
jgi:hypothetical protein